MMSVFSDRRILSVVFPRLSTDRLKRRTRYSFAAPSDRPLVIVDKIKGALVTVAVDEAASIAGLKTGMTLATARALCPSLDVADSNATEDYALLNKIADWMERYTPCVGLVAPDTVTLDITGAAHLFGGEAALLADCLTQLQRQGFHTLAAIAGTAETAAALAQFSDTAIVAPDHDAVAVNDLPIAALGLSYNHIIALARLGLKSIGDLVSRPRAPLAARFGTDLLARLDNVRGLTNTSITPRRLIPPFIAERRFAEPIGHEDDIHRTILTLASDLSRLLEKQGKGGRRFELSCFRTDGMTRRMGIETARPLRDPKSIMRLFRERLDALADPLDPGFGFDVIRLTVPLVEFKDAHEPDFDGNHDLAEDLAALIERLGTRLHPNRITRLMPQSTHQPERAAASIPAQDGNAALQADWEIWREPDYTPTRPIRLLDPPEPVDVVSEAPDGPPIRFRWRRVFHVVVKAEGPERLAPEWWRMTGQVLSPTRDYYRVENEEGARFWLFRAGLYERETHDPRWFIQGLFG